MDFMKNFFPEIPHKDYEFRDIGSNLWTVSGALKLGQMQAGCRMSVARLAGGGLWLHSPVPITEAVCQFLAEKGDVQHVVAPNDLHHLYLEDYLKKYPQAKAWGSERVIKQHPNVNIIKFGASSPWNEFKMCLLKGKRLNEYVFLHQESATLIVTDLGFNIVPPEKTFDRIMYSFMDVSEPFGWSKLGRFVFFGKGDEFRSGLRELAHWDFDNLLMSHGKEIIGGGKQAFTTGFAKLIAP